MAIPAVLGILTAVVGVVLATQLASDDDTEREASSSSSSPTDEPTPPLQEAYDLCSAGKGGNTLRVGDDGKTLVIDTHSEYGSIQGLVCVLAELDTSEAIVAQMENTTSMMGVQEADDSGMHCQFSYHPDNGINMVITGEGDEK